MFENGVGPPRESLCAENRLQDVGAMVSPHNGIPIGWVGGKRWACSPRSEVSITRIHSLSLVFEGRECPEISGEERK